MVCRPTGEGSVAHAPVPNDWHIQGTGDFNGDLNADILWRHDNGQVYFWEMNGLQIQEEGARFTLRSTTIGTFREWAISTAMARATLCGDTTAGRCTFGR
jgi:hypothetical protein